jgi:hypothetical protein
MFIFLVSLPTSSLLSFFISTYLTTVGFKCFTFVTGIILLLRYVPKDTAEEEKVMNKR